MIRLGVLYAAVTLCFGPHTASAQPFPVLSHLSPELEIAKLRAEPSADARVIVEHHRAMGALELLGNDVTGNWIEVSTPQGEAWVKATDIALADSPNIPNRLFCLGHQPAWQIQIREDVIFVDYLDGFIEAMDMSWSDTSFNAPQAEYGYLGASPDGDISAVITLRRCRDTVSDIRYGLTAQAIITLYGTPRLVSGCCTLKP